ncbi:hypothetical protein PGT21_037120 [Puccinia graminis f. sp. tritici]|uniref:HAT C-terminal dimerisation domain-containing protein n=1 Tax=Puccinia graminis f. sp. tritici TaxID=56615 RepID=A0A5B0R4Z1_PUCGR|nr:hypothetical protein PGT21_037120 [Puccinia graminis f. sp. tritici]
MSERVKKYLAEAMESSTLVLATMMHPCYRIRLFELAFGADSSEVINCLSLLQLQYQRAKDQAPVALQGTDPDVMVLETTMCFKPDSLMDRLSRAQKPLLDENEIEAYMKADISFKAEDLAHKSTPLKWWKAHHETYPILAILAREYLGAPGSSCAVERLFSAASDVCRTSRGSLLPSTISHSVSSLMWLREEVPLSGEFDEAGRCDSVAAGKNTARKENDKVAHLRYRKSSANDQKSATVTGSAVTQCCFKQCQNPSS